MKLLKHLIPFICILSMIGFEAVRDLSFFYEVDSTDMAVLTNMSEEDSTGKENKSGGNSLYELDIDFEELAISFYLREIVWFEIIRAHDLRYQLLEQKVVLPPPELLFS
jgi:hypothetical protein